VFGLILPSDPVNTGDLVKLKFQAHRHPPQANSPHPAGQSASYANFSTRPKK